MEERNTQTAGNPYLYNGKEPDEMTGLYYYGARCYDAGVGLFLGVDAKAEEFSHQSAYVYADNNPISFIDVWGLSARPYYDDETGEFLGVDENGFAGQIKVTSKKAYSNAEKNKDGTVKSASIANCPKTKNIQDSNMTDEAIAKIYTDIFNKINDPRITLAKFYNGSISIFNNKIVNGEAGGYNDPDFAPGASYVNMGEDGHKITINRSKLDLYNTVENAQNTLGAHEMLGHGVFGIGGDASGMHYKVYEIQISHSTWENTTYSYKKRIVISYLKKLYQENPQKYNSDPNVSRLYYKYINQ